MHVSINLAIRVFLRASMEQFQVNFVNSFTFKQHVSYMLVCYYMYLVPFYIEMTQF